MSRNGKGVKSFRYKNKDTLIHRLNPFCKLAWIGSILLFALIFNNPLYVLLLFLSTIPLIVMAKIIKEWFSVMKLTLYLCIAIVIINALVSNDGSHVLLKASFHIPVMGTPMITLEAIFFGVIMSLRLLIIISAFAVLTFTIHPDDLMLVMIKLRLPYKSVLVTSLSTRFIPTLIDDVERIIDVQRSRGLELDKGRLGHKIKSRMSIVIPLLSNSLDRATQVAEAMESRAFGAEKVRTFYKDIRTSFIDAITLALVLATIVFGFIVQVSGYGGYQYYPTLERMAMGSTECFMLTLLLILLLSIVPLSIVKRRFDLD